MNVTLIGGGWDETRADELYGPFLDAAADRAGGNHPRVACVAVDEGDGAEQVQRWAAVLERVRTVEPVPILVPLGSAADLSSTAAVDGLLVCGGLTPAYAEALAPVAGGLRDLLNGGLPYAGFSAGAAVASRWALVGGWRVDGVPVCDEDAGEDLDEVTIVAGLGLVDWPIDVHARQWGTVPRLEAAVRRQPFAVGYAIDEDTAIRCTDSRATVVGAGAVHRVTASATTEIAAPAELR